MKADKHGVSRRDFMQGALTAGAAVGGLTILGAAARGAPKKSYTAGLVGCGGRGRGAMINHLDAAKHLGIDVKITALCDVYPDRLQQARDRLKIDKMDIPDDRCFTGYSGYKKLIDTDVDIVLLATAPVFRPLHFETAVKAGKHVFMEKPVCVDPVGGQRIVAAGEAAKAKNLGVVAGTQRRHQGTYLGAKKLIDDGAIGTIWGGVVYWTGAKSWVVDRTEGMSDIDYITRNWINFFEMSGDHIIEQHVHNIDVMCWFMGGPPSLAVSFGGRARRKTGNCYDFFATDYSYQKGAIHVTSACRQITGAWSRVAEQFVGEKGLMKSGRIKLHSKEKIKAPDFPGQHRNPYVQEHVALLDSILKEKPLNEASQIAESTLVGVMGRLSAYTGQPIRYSDVAEADGRFGKLALAPSAEDFETGKVTIPKDDVIPVPGKE